MKNPQPSSLQTQAGTSFATKEAEIRTFDLQTDGPLLGTLVEEAMVTFLRGSRAFGGRELCEVEKRGKALSIATTYCQQIEPGPAQQDHDGLLALMLTISQTAVARAEERLKHEDESLGLVTHSLAGLKEPATK